MSANMNDDYLWDRSGEPDPEIERLERALSPLRGTGRLPPAALLPLTERRERRRWRWLPAVGVACAAAMALVAWRITSHSSRQDRPFATGERAATQPARPATSAPVAWALTVVAGQPQIERGPVHDGAGLAPGGTLTTDASARARLDVPSIGVIEVGPVTRLRLVQTGRGAHRVSLERGTIDVLIWSPPGTFFVETPAGVAVDLGCAYTVSVDDAGEGSISVKSGWVGVERNGRESFIPAGAECRISRGRGPGTPHFADSPQQFREALAVFDRPDGFKERARALRQVLRTARPRDAVTLWHLIGRVESEERALVLRRLIALLPTAGGVDRAAAAAGDQRALDDLWNRLDLGPIADWRRWKAVPAAAPER